MKSYQMNLAILNWTKKLILFLFLNFLISCTSLSKNDIPLEKDLEKLNPLELRLGFDVIDVKLDMIRSELEYLCDSPPCTKIADRHNIGIYLGNGIFLDAHLNLTLDLVDYFQLKDKDFSFQILDGNVTTKVQKNAKEVNIEDDSFFERRYKAAFTEKGAKLDPDSILFQKDIFVEPNRILFDPRDVVVIGTSKSGVEKVSETKSRMVTRATKPIEIELQSNKVLIGDRFVIEYANEKIHITKKSTSKDVHYTLLKSKGKVVFFNNQDLQGFYFTIQGNNVLVFEAMGTKKNYTMEGILKK